MSPTLGQEQGKPGRPLSKEMLAEGLSYLLEQDPDLARVHTEIGPPPMWSRKPGFPTLVHIILEQQVSLASARAAFDRLLQAASPLTPERFLALDDGTLRTVGFSTQKARYGRLLAEAIVSGGLELDRLDRLDDATARAELVRHKGIGPWTADIYLLMALGRQDIWPAGDLALAVAVQRLKGLQMRPSPAEMEELATPWRPWRAVAARLLWHAYLSHNRQTPRVRYNA